MEKNLDCCNCNRRIGSSWWIRVGRFVYCELCKKDLDIFIEHYIIKLLKAKANSSDDYKSMKQWLNSKPLPLLRKLVR